MRRTPIYDAQAALGFVNAQTTYIEPGVYAIEYADIQYPDLIPIDTSAPEFAKSVTFYSADMFGKAEWINGGSDDIPRAGTERTRYETPVYTAAIGYGYSWEEVGQAMMLGVPLQSDDAAAARRAAMEMADNVFLRGDARKGMQGLFNSTGVTVLTNAGPSWDTASAAQILATVNQGLMGTFNGTNYTSLADILVLPYEKLQALGSAVLTGTSKTVLDFLYETNLYTRQTGRPLTIRGAYGLLNAGVGGTARMVAYKKDPRVLKAHMPMPHKFLPVYQSGPLRFEVPGVMRLGGLDIRQPQNFRYVDGL